MLFRRSVNDALKAVKNYNTKKIAVSLKYNRKCKDKRSNIRAMLVYLGLLDKIRNQNLNASIFVDPEKIGSRFEERFFLANKEKIIKKANKYKIRVDFDDVRLSDFRIAKRVLKNDKFSCLDGSNGRFVYNVHKYVSRKGINKKRFEFRIDEKDKLDRHFPNYNVRLLYKFG